MAVPHIQEEETMKMIMVVYNYSIDEELMDALKECGVEGYTHFSRVTGNGGQGPHRGDNIWPALNNVLYIAVPTDKFAKKILSVIKELKGRFKSEGIQAWSWTVDAEV